VDALTGSGVEGGRQEVVVAHVVLGLRIGGLERVVVDLVNLSSAVIRPAVVCLERAGALAAELRRPGTPLLEIDRRPGLRPWLAVRVSRVLRRHGARLVHTHNTAAGFYGGLAGRLCGVPVVHTKHGQNLAGEASQGWLNRLLYRISDHVVAVSEPARELALAEGARPSSLSVIDNGIDVERFRSGPAERQAARAALRLPAEAFVVGTVARLAPEKSQSTLIEAFAALGSDGPGPRPALVLVGGGTEEGLLRGRAEELGVAERVVFAGPRTDVARLLPAFDVFALPSSSEGLPVALLEAMAAGLAAVVTAVGAMPQVVENGRSGLVVPPRDAQALARALESLRRSADARGSLGRAAVDRVRETYGARRMARQYEAIYSRLLGRVLD
jgi:glycosyltransferase involved in cell wall biosynthesis